MKNLFSLLILSSAFLLVSCGDDEATINIDYPLTVKPTNVLVKEDLQIFVNNGGTVTAATAADTDLDENEVFTEIDTQPSFEQITFVSDTEATFLRDGDEISATYNISSGTITFDVTEEFFGAMISYSVVATGTPQNMAVQSQAYVLGEDGFSLSSTGAIREDIEDLKSELEDGDTLVFLNYTEQYTEE